MLRSAPSAANRLESGLKTREATPLRKVGSTRSSLPVPASAMWT
jgi:hypothetical protein